MDSMTHRNLFYSTELKISGEKKELGTKSKILEGSKNSKFKNDFQNDLISTSNTTSRVPEHAIRPVSSSEYDVTNFQICS